MISKEYKKKIVVIGRTYPYKGGISHFNTLLCQTLKKRFNTILISWRRLYPNFLYPTDPKDKISQKRLETKSLNILDYLNPFSWLRTFFIIKKQKPDLVILHWLHPVMSPVFTTITFLVKRFTQSKILYICHNVLPHEKVPLARLLTKLALRRGDFFIVHSRKDKRDLESIKKNAKIKIGFLPLYDTFSDDEVDIEGLRQKLKLKENNILFFGFIRKYKGLEYLIRALPLVLKEINVDLVIAGEFWKNKKDYLDLIKTLGLKKHIRVVDQYIPNEEIKGYFKISDVVVLPYVSGTQSAIVQLAYSQNRPVITTNVGGIAEAVVDRKTGYIVEPKNPQVLAKKIIQFYKENKKDEFIENVKKIKKRFSWNNYIKIIEEFI